MIIKGDINGDGRIDYLDLVLAQAHQFGDLTLTGDAFTAADINNDGVVDYDDVFAISNHISGVNIINEVIE